MDSRFRPSFLLGFFSWTRFAYSLTINAWAWFHHSECLCGCLLVSEDEDESDAEANEAALEAAKYDIT